MDKRKGWKVKHNLLEIIVMTICAAIARCEAWEDICDDCRVKEGRLHKTLGMKLEHGVPSHDTARRVWLMIKPAEFEKCFCAWANEQRMVLGELAVKEKSNEINAVPDYLELVFIAV